MQDKWDLRTFNVSQREAICHNTGPALVLAGPGSGKTTVITKRLQYLTDSLHIPPEEILVVTFTKAAAREMQQRFRALARADRPVRFGTFHAVYYHILREHAKIPLIVIQEKEKQDYIRRILRQERVSEELADSVLTAISRVKNQGSAEGSLLAVGKGEGALSGDSLPPQQMDSIFRKYRQLCREKGKLDFDDMAYECLQLLQKRPDILQIWRRRCRYILADEYQDIAPIQEKILFLLAASENNLFLVGDDDQSIYGFRGAGTESMLSFPKRFPETKQIFLEMNYRSRPGIIQASGKVIAQNKDRFMKMQTAAREASGQKEVYCRGFFDRTIQNREIVELLRGLLRENKLSESAVLFRKSADADALAALLERGRIPSVRMDRAKNRDFHFIMDDITAYLHFIYGERTRKNFYKIMNRPDRGIDRAGCSQETVSFGELLTYHSYDKDIMRNIQKLEKDCRMVGGMKLYAALMYIRKGMGYEAFLRSEHKGAALEECMETLLRLQTLAGRVSGLAEWERHLQEKKGNDGKQCAGNLQRGGVRILTYHGSKGLEFDYVILPDLNEGIVPHKKAVSEKQIEEERRMFYVAMTRAREKLYLYYTAGTKEEPELASRFLKPLMN